MKITLNVIALLIIEVIICRQYNYYSFTQHTAAHNIYTMQYSTQSTI